MATIHTPLFWDLHLHGVAGIDFMHASPDAMAYACETLGSRGIEAFAPTLLTAEPTLLLEACQRWGRFLSRARTPGVLPAHSAHPIGLHLEGPFLNPKTAGAHPSSCLTTPSVNAARELVGAARGQVAIVTLSPELRGAPATIRWLASHGIRVQMGHSQATAAQAWAATRAGCRGLTHLFNAMTYHHRNPGLMAPWLAGKVSAEIITDGCHIDPHYVRWAAETSSGGLYAVSDGCCAIPAQPGMSWHGPRSKTLGSISVRRQNHVAVIASGPKQGVMAGGATWLTSHPELLAPAFVGPHLQSQVRRKRGWWLALFYPGADRPFRSTRRRFNHFDANSFRYLGTDT